MERAGLSIRIRLLLGFAAVLVLSAVANIYGLMQIGVLADLTTMIYEHPLKATQSALSADALIFKMHRGMRDIVLAKDEAEIDATEATVDKKEREVLKHLGIVRESILDEEGRKLTDTVMQSFKDWRPMRDETVVLMKEGRMAEAIAITKGRSARHVAFLDQDVQRLEDFATAKATEIFTNVQKIEAKAMNTAVAALLVVIAAGGLLGFLVARNIADPLRTVTQIANRLAVGDVEQRIAIDRMDEIGVMANAFQRMIGYQQEMAEAANRLARGDLAVALVPKGESDVLGYAFNKMVMSLRNLAEQVETISGGDLNTRVELRSEQDLLARSVNRMTDISKEVARQAGLIATGDYSADFQPRSDKDELVMALREMIRTLREVTAICEAVAASDYSRSVALKGERDLLGRAINQMVANLKEVTAENEMRIWMSTGQTELNDKIRGQLDVSILAGNIIGFLCEYLDAQVGGLYVHDGNNSFRLMGSYAYSERKSLSNRFELGEALVGQAALERKSILISNVPDNYVRITSGLGEKTPRNILVSPFMFEDRVYGVVEIGSFTELSGARKIFLESVMESIAIAFNTAQIRERTNELLVQTQMQAEELQRQTEELTSQQEELRQTNEELEEQTLTLKESEMRLKTQQEELQATNEELEEKTKALEQQEAAVRKQNKELQTAREELERRARELTIASKYKSEFLANMSHELRTPLNSLLILARMLSDNEGQNLTDEQVEMAKVIFSSGNELLSLINEILDLAKVEAGKMDLHVEHVRLDALAETIGKTFSHVAQQKELAFQVNLGAGLPDTIHTDRKRMEQIIKNLMANALKFTEQGLVEVSIHRPESGTKFFHSSLDPQHTIGISVSDTGIGISQEHQMIIFEAFQQANGTTSRKYWGTGLGLSISRELARLLGGEIGLKSTLGEGSSFTLYLPEDFTPGADREAGSCVRGDQTKIPGLEPESLALSNEPATFNAAPTAAISDDRENLGEGDRVLLIIEDDPAFAKILYDFAHDNGFKCLVASEGEAGLELAIGYKPAAVILDIELPGISGWGTLSQLKNNADTQHIPVHIMSVHEESLDAYKKGAIGYLTKPASQEKLDEAFQRIGRFIAEDIRTLLIVEDDEQTRVGLRKLIGGSDVDIVETGSGEEAWGLIKSRRFDCMILDLRLPDVSGFELLDRLQADETIPRFPVIVYTGKELSREESRELMRYADTIIVKGVKSQERLLDETALFLHRVIADMPETKRRMIKRLYDKDAILQDKKILIVDDDMRNSFALSKLLTDRGMKVEIAEDGQRALEVLTEQPDIDLVLMDIMMPVMDGFETTLRIREQKEFRNLPILALTAKAMKGDREKCLAAGANDYLAKPVDTDRLFSMLRVWLYQ